MNDILGKDLFGCCFFGKKNATTILYFLIINLEDALK